MRARASIDLPLRTLVRALVSAAPAHLGRVDPERVLVIAAAARKDAHASIRALSFGGHPPRYASEGGRLQKPEIMIDGVEMLFEIALRPRFFLDTTTMERVSILAHELYHIDPDLVGRLSEARRHAHSTPGELEHATKCIVEAWQERGSIGREAVEDSGEVTLSAWRVRPPSRMLPSEQGPQRYTEQHLYPAIVRFGP